MGLRHSIVLVIFSVSSCNYVRLGLLGPDGTFSSEAGYNYIKRKRIKARIKYYKTITNCFIALKRKEVEEIIVPLVNTTIGYIGETLRNLNGLSICDKEIIPIVLHLIVKLYPLELFLPYIHSM